MVYNNDKSLKYLLFEEGLVNKSSGGYAYEYHLKDHLGNTRVTFQPNGSSTTTTQVAEYYPFGSSYLPVSPAGSNKYLYNGKEKQDDVLSGSALDWYDYSARYYDPQIGRFTTVDPLAEKKPWLSPYTYCSDNPINRIDPDGKDDYTLDNKGNIKLSKQTDSKQDMLIAVGKSGKLGYNKKGELTNKSTLIDKGILTQKNHQEADYNNNLSRDKISRDTYELNKMDDKKSVGVFKFMAKNTDVEWSLTIGNDKNGNALNILTTTHLEGTVGSLTEYYQDYKGYNVKIDYHNHPSGDPIPSGAYGDQGYAKNVLKKSPGAAFNIYTKQDDKMHPYDTGE